MPRRIFYAGTIDEVRHHAQALMGQLPVEILSCNEIQRAAEPGDVCIFYNEFFDRFRDLCRGLNVRGCRTVYAIDGILEWRNLWENPPAHPLGGEPNQSAMRPALSQVVACIGANQARTLSAWGNAGKCVVMGIPRLDQFPATIKLPTNDTPPTLLIVTAKNPGFTQPQRETTLRSLSELRDSIRQRYPALRVIWRLTAGLDRQLGVASDTRALSEQLSESSAVVTTPSTAMLEAMLASRPVALLDFHNRPHYVPAAWTMTAPTQFFDMLASILNADPRRMQYQQELLYDSLGNMGTATSRFVQLIRALHEAKPEVPTSQILSEYRVTGGESPVLPQSHPAERNHSDLSHSMLRQEIDELRERLNVANARLEDFARHPVLGPLLRLRQRWNRWPGQPGSTRT